MRAGARRAVGAGALALLVACQTPPAPPPATSGPGDPVRIARETFRRGDCAAAAPLLRGALGRAPDDLGLHYGLAVCASRLDQRDEAVREFQWVLRHAPSGSEEWRVARGWLAEAGVGGDDGRDAGQRPPLAAAVAGRAMASDPGQGTRPLGRLQLHLTGLAGTPTEGVNHVIRADEEGRFAFRGLPAGPYRLTDRVAGTPRWRLRVDLEPGQELVMDLTPANGVGVRDDFPERRG